MAYRVYAQKNCCYFNEIKLYPLATVIVSRLENQYLHKNIKYKYVYVDMCIE